MGSYDYKEYVSSGGVNIGKEEYSDTLCNNSDIVKFLEAIGLEIHHKKKFLNEILHIDYQIKIFYLKEQQEAYYHFGEFMKRLEHENCLLR